MSRSMNPKTSSLAEGVVAPGLREIKSALNSAVITLRSELSALRSTVTPKAYELFSQGLDSLQSLLKLTQHVTPTSLARKIGATTLLLFSAFGCDSPLLNKKIDTSFMLDDGTKATFYSEKESECFVKLERNPQRVEIDCENNEVAGRVFSNGKPLFTTPNEKKNAEKAYQEPGGFKEQYVKKYKPVEKTTNTEAKSLDKYALDFLKKGYIFALLIGILGLRFTYNNYRKLKGHKVQNQLEPHKNKLVQYIDDFLKNPNNPDLQESIKELILKELRAPGITAWNSAADCLENKHQFSLDTVGRQIEDRATSSTKEISKIKYKYEDEPRTDSFIIMLMGIIATVSGMSITMISNITTNLNNITNMLSDFGYTLDGLLTALLFALIIELQTKSIKKKIDAHYDTEEEANEWLLLELDRLQKIWSIVESGPDSHRNRGKR